VSENEHSVRICARLFVFGLLQGLDAAGSGLVAAVAKIFYAICISTGLLQLLDPSGASSFFFKF
jgi:hypothetical protein